MFELSNRSKKRMEGVDHRLIEIADLAITLTTIDFGIPGDGGIRTAVRQRELFDKNRSMCDGVENKSYHQSGMALDYFAYVDGKASWDVKHLAFVAAAFLQAASILGHKLEWSGLWAGSFKEFCHVQLLDEV